MLFDLSYVNILLSQDLLNGFIDSSQEWMK